MTRILNEEVRVISFDDVPLLTLFASRTNVPPAAAMEYACFDIIRGNLYLLEIVLFEREMLELTQAMFANTIKDDADRQQTSLWRTAVLREIKDKAYLSLLHLFPEGSRGDFDKITKEFADIYSGESIDLSPSHVADCIRRMG